MRRRRSRLLIGPRAPPRRHYALRCRPDAEAPGSAPRGFVLGTAIATRFGKGFLTIRKAGRVPVETDVVDFVNDSGRTQQMEMRKPAFAPGTRVPLVDQWVETAGTMDAGIRLVERQRGVVAGIAAVCIEESDTGAGYRGRCRCSTAVIPGTAGQDQCNRQTMDHFAGFDPACHFPETA